MSNVNEWRFGLAAQGAAALVLLTCSTDSPTTAARDDDRAPARPSQSSSEAGSESDTPARASATEDPITRTSPREPAAGSGGAGASVDSDTDDDPPLPVSEQSDREEPFDDSSTVPTSALPPLSLAECETAMDCTNSGADARCSSPLHPVSTTACGAAAWCGQCSCPPLSLAPTAWGESCSSDDDCAREVAAEGIGEQGAALWCHPELGACQLCRSDADCGEDAPHCSAGAHGLSSCQRCVTHEHCSVEAPFCRTEGYIPLPRLDTTRCVECRDTTDCESGICVSNTCTPQCAQHADCMGRRVMGCFQERCQWYPCDESGECPANTACEPESQICLPARCEARDDCESAYCVMGECWPVPGNCTGSAPP